MSIRSSYVIWVLSATRLLFVLFFVVNRHRVEEPSLHVVDPGDHDVVGLGQLGFLHLVGSGVGEKR